MRALFILILFFFVVLVCPSCNNEDAVADDTNMVEEIPVVENEDENIEQIQDGDRIRAEENKQKLQSLILSCNKPASIPVKSLSQVVETKDMPDENSVPTPCHFETWSEVTDLSEIISLDPNNNVIWPGAVIQGRSLLNGSPALINLPRNTGRITMSGLIFNDSISNSVPIQEPNEGNIKNTISGLIRRPVVSTEGRFSYTANQTFSAEHSLQSIGLAAKWHWGELSSQLSSSDYTNKNNFIVKLTQKYYSVSFEDPPSPEAVFKNDVDVEQASLYMGQETPPALITNVNYGRLIIISFSTSEDAVAFKAALDASFSGWGTSGSLNVNSENKKVLSNSEVKIYAIGGSSEKIAKVITNSEGKDKIQLLNEYIEHGADFSLESPGSPIGYKAVFLSDNSVAAINSPLEFKKVKCDPKVYQKPLKITVNKMVIYDVQDDDEDMDFGYSVQFLGRNDELLDQFNNAAYDVYVEEPGKVGGEKGGVNSFFHGQSKVINQPVFKVKCIVWAKSRDGDSKRPWRGGASQERTYNFAEFKSPSPFNPWESMSLSLTME